MLDQIIPYIKPLAIQIAYAIGFLTVGVVISRVIASNISKKIIHNDPSPGTKKMARVVHNMITMGSFITLLLISISIVGINISLIIGGIGLAIGYAMEEVLGNIFASLMIVTHHRYHVGDTIKIEGDINQLGVIENVSTRITTIRTYDKQRLMIPNLTMIRTPIIPFSKKGLVRCEGTISVPRQIDLAHIKPIITQAINNHPVTAAQEYTVILLTDYSEGGSVITYYYYFNANNPEGLGKFKYVSQVNQSIHQAFQQAQINIPYPRRLLETSKLS